MPQVTLTNGRLYSDIRMHVSLKDSGVAIDWSTLSDIRAYLYSVEQKQICGPCDLTLDGTDLVCDYSADSPQYEGKQRVIVRCTYHGRKKTYDAIALNLVPSTDDLASQAVVLEDPEVDVEITVTDVDTSILDAAIDAAFEAAEKANEAAEHGPYIDDTTHNWMVWDADAGAYVDTGICAGGSGGGITVDSQLSTTSENPVQNKVITGALNNKVNKEEGKGLSTEDYTAEEKAKLASITVRNPIALRSMLIPGTFTVEQFETNYMTIAQLTGLASGQYDGATYVTFTSWTSANYKWASAGRSETSFGQTTCTVFLFDDASEYKIVYNGSSVVITQAVFYSKPSGGIPPTDMTEAVQASLGKADTAVQPAALEAVTDLIPAAASEQNQLADKAFVNSSVATATATYRGSYNLVTDLSLTTAATRSDIATALAGAVSTADNNDYAFVQVPTADATPTEIARVERYKYNGSAWAFEYALNDSGFTAAQWAALNSGITSGLVSKLSTLPTNSELTTLLNGKQPLIDSSNKLDYGLLSNTPPSVPTPSASDKDKVLTVSDTSGTLGWSTPKGGDDEAIEVAAAALCEHEKKIKDAKVGVLTGDDVKNDLATVAARKPLSATQGKVLKDLSDENEGIIAQALNDLSGLRALASALAPAYSGAKTYAVGEVAVYGNTLYQCSTPVTDPEPFHAAKWTVTDLFTVILTLINA